MLFGSSLAHLSISTKETAFLFVCVKIFVFEQSLTALSDIIVYQCNFFLKTQDKLKNMVYNVDCPS